MKVLLMRSGEAEMDWKDPCTPEEFRKGLQDYEDADLRPVVERLNRGDYARIYVGPSKHARQTAETVFGTMEYEVLPELQEPWLELPPLREKNRPLHVYRRRMILAWQQEKLRHGAAFLEAREQSRRLIDRLAAQGEDTILIAGERILEVLLMEYRKQRDIEIFRRSTFGISPLERIRVTEKQPHCGGCHFNCLLSNPGCVMGKERAAKQIIQGERL